MSDFDFRRCSRMDRVNFARQSSVRFVATVFQRMVSERSSPPSPAFVDINEFDAPDSSRPLVYHRERFRRTSRPFTRNDMSPNNRRKLGRGR